MFALAAAVGAAVPAVSGAAAAPGAQAADNGRITYFDVLARTIHVVDADGGNDSVLTSAANSAPAWSPDGSRFVYSSDQGLKTKRFDGSGEVTITGTNALSVDATWIPEGWAIVYSHQGSLQFVYPDNSRFPIAMLPPEQGVGHTEPTAAPGGEIVFTRSTGSDTSLYRTFLGDETAQPLIANASQPSFSPDGSKLAYVAKDANQLDQIWVADASGANPTKLTDEEAGAIRPHWSPDGSTILALRDGIGEVHPVVKIAVEDAVVTPLGKAGTGASWQPVARNDVHRLWGQDHVETAIAASQYNYVNTGDARAVVLSRDDTFLDALVGSAFAIKEQAPLLITNRSALDARVEAEIQRLLGGSGTVYLLGGEIALGPAVASRLTSLGYGVQRIWGQTHFDTAIELNRRITPTPSTAIVTTGINFFDALAAGAAAGANPGTVIVLTNGTLMPPSSASYLNGLNPDFTAPNGTLIVTAGGPGDRALEDAYTHNQMPSWPQEVSAARLVGTNEMDTALLLADFFFAAPELAALATNVTWFDALTGGAMIGLRYGPLLITPPNALYPGVRDYLSRGSGNIGTGVMLGGPAALPKALEAPLGDAIGLPGQWDYVDITPGSGAAAAAPRAQRTDEAVREDPPMGAVPPGATLTR
jgi:ell wall binding domain 2 (CWB2)/WD40-like Beta Propeller Repeat